MNKGFEKIRIEEESRVDAGIRVFKVENSQAFDLQDFNLPNIQSTAGQESLRKLGVGAREQASKKHQTFVMNSLVTGPASTQEMLKREVEALVEKRLLEEQSKAKSAGFKQGYEEGLEKIKQEIFLQMQEEAQANLQRLNSFLDEMENAKNEVLRSSERLIIEMIYGVAKEVLLKQLETDRGYVVRLCESLFEKVSGSEFVCIKVSEGDFENIKSFEPEWTERLKKIKNFRIEIAEGVVQGGCLVETDWGGVDARVETQLEHLRSSLIKESFESPNGS
jgi:flagellar assembly protein FliH